MAPGSAGNCRGEYQFAILTRINGTTGRSATGGRTGTTAEVCAVVREVNKMVWGSDGELGEATEMAGRIAAFLGVSSN